MELLCEVAPHDVAEDHLHEVDLQDSVVGFLETVWAHHVFGEDPHERIENSAVEGVMHFAWEGPQASLVETLVVFVVVT